MKSIERLKNELKFLEELEKRGLLKHWEDIQEHHDNLRHGLAKAKRLMADNERLEIELNYRLAQEQRKKPGAKWKWKGKLGFNLICAVKALTADGTSNAQAFRDLHDWARFWHSNPKAQQTKEWIKFEQLVGEHWAYIRDECSRQKPRQLAARHSEALKAWGSYFEQDDILDAEMERFRALSDAIVYRSEKLSLKTEEPLLRKPPQK
jgi:hypothetical protein